MQTPPEFRAPLQALCDRSTRRPARHAEPPIIPHLATDAIRSPRRHPGTPSNEAAPTADCPIRRDRLPEKNRATAILTFDFSIPEARLLLTLFPRVVRTRNSPRISLRLTSHRIPSSRGLTNGINEAMIECVHEASWSPPDASGDIPDDLGWDPATMARCGTDGLQQGSVQVHPVLLEGVVLPCWTPGRARPGRIDRTWAARCAAGREGR